MNSVPTIEQRERLHRRAYLATMEFLEERREQAEAFRAYAQAAVSVDDARLREILEQVLEARKP